MIFEYIQTPDAAVEDTRKLHIIDILTILCIVERDNRRRSQKHRTTSLSGREQSHDQTQSRRAFRTCPKTGRCD